MIDLGSVVFKNRNILFKVKRNRKGLTQLFISNFVFRSFTEADHRIEPIEAKMPKANLYGARQLNLARHQFFGLARAILNRHLIPNAWFTSL